MKRCLVVGLGNPGAEYESTRHNIGFMAVDHIADTYSISLLKNKFNLIYGQGQIEGVPVVLAKPQSYMNRSGLPTRQLADYFRIPSGDILIVHDDIDLAFRKIKIKTKGGDGGHRGVRSVKDAFGTGEFSRLRMGVGRGMTAPGGDKGRVVGHVLGRFSMEENRQMTEVLTLARDAVVTILREGVGIGMNRYNGK